MLRLSAAKPGEFLAKAPHRASKEKRARPATRARNFLPKSKQPGRRLFLLDRLDVVGQVRHALLHFSFVPTTHIPEQLSPYWHIFGSVCGKIRRAANSRSYFQRGKFPPVVLAELGEIRGRSLQGAGCGPSAFAVCSVADCAIRLIHLFAGNR